MTISPTPITLVRSRAALTAALSTGIKPDYFFFFGHTNRVGGVTKACLSQWWPCTFTADGQTWKSAEHYLMAAKARLFGDEASEKAIRAAATPDVAQALGRKVAHYDDAKWAAKRFDVAVAGNLAKFGQDPKLARFLRSTGNRVIVEASPHDKIWGIGALEADPRSAHPDTWDGENLLGFALMEVRQRLAAAVV